MDSPGPAGATQRLVSVLSNIRIARDTYRLRLEAPAMARLIRPGQFVMVRPGSEGASDPLLGRPLALYEVVRDPSGAAVALDIVYLVVGRGTAALAQRKPGERVMVWGPLGNGFGPPPEGSVVFVAGGIGQTPFLALGRWWLGQADYGGGDLMGDRENADQGHKPSNLRTTTVSLLYGVRTAALLAGVDDFRDAGFEVEIATDDGTAGHHGFVTDLLTKRLEQGDRPAKIVGCGPPPMLAAVARIARQFDVTCDVSLENAMACGFGVCFSCVAPILQPDGSTDLRRVCLEGPIVRADLVDWARLSH